MGGPGAPGEPGAFSRCSSRALGACFSCCCWPPCCWGVTCSSQTRSSDAPHVKGTLRWPERPSSSQVRGGAFQMIFLNIFVMFVYELISLCATSSWSSSLQRCDVRKPLLSIGLSGRDALLSDRQYRLCSCCHTQICCCCVCFPSMLITCKVFKVS